MIILNASVRLAIKNSLIVAALRDHEDYSLTLAAAIAVEELLRLAEENEATARRLDAEAERYRGRITRPGNEFDELRSQDQRRRPAILRLLATALRAEADDSDRINEMVSTAHAEARDEVQAAVTSELLKSSFEPDARYEADHKERLKALIKTDLAALARQAKGRA